MAEKHVGPAADLDGSGLRVALIRTRWNPEVVDRLARGVDRALVACGVAAYEVVEVPGAFEIPFAARTLAASGRVDALVAIGAVIRGETTHYDLVSEECARGLQDVQISTGVPVGFGVLATENLEQALARSEDGAGPDAAHDPSSHNTSAHTPSSHNPSAHNVGADAAMVAVEMALLARAWR